MLQLFSGLNSDGNACSVWHSLAGICHIFPLPNTMDHSCIGSVEHHCQRPPRALARVTSFYEGSRNEEPNPGFVKLHEVLQLILWSEFGRSTVEA